MNDFDPRIERSLSFWFGDLDADGLASDAAMARWWKKDPAFDATICEAFAGDHAAIVAGECEAWRESARGSLAYVIVLDQFSRNMFRDLSAMFSQDGLALTAAKRAIEQRFDRELPVAMASFFYLPLMHSESLADQDRCVGHFRSLALRAAPRAQKSLQSNIDFALRHREIIARFGRFPHRNAILGRASTTSELEFLGQPGSSF